MEPRWAAALTLAATLASAAILASPAVGLPAARATVPPAAPSADAANLTGSGDSPAVSQGPAIYSAPGEPAPIPDNGSGIQAIVDSEEAAGAGPNVILPPHPSAGPAAVSAAATTGAIRPLYSGTPAPMGLAYYGLSAGASGAVVPTVLNTTAIQGTVDMNATGVRAGDLYNNEGDGFSIQLNAVLANVSLFGQSGYEFWTQDVVQYYPLGHFMRLGTNIWNFSSAGARMSANALYGHSAWGSSPELSGIAGVYYASYTLPDPVRYPFNLTLTLTSSLSQGRDEVSLGVAIVSARFPQEDFSSANLTNVFGQSRPYDYAIFNSTAAAHRTALRAPAEFQANGEAYNPYGLVNDFELVFGGVDSGEQSTLLSADAKLGLAYRDGGDFVPVPAAYSYGSDTGETTTGADVAWSSAPAGAPHGLAEYGTMTTGPSLLTGLWGTGVPGGSFPVRLQVRPSNAFELFSAGTGWPTAFTVHEPSLAPGQSTDTVYLTPGNYTLTSELSGYEPKTIGLEVIGPSEVVGNLTADASVGIYTPLWAFSNAEVAALSTNGNGTPANPYRILNEQSAPISSSFGLYNDYKFPVYPAVYFYGTSASVEFDSPPQLAVATNLSQYPGPSLPTVDYLQYWFWNVSNVSVLNASAIRGWEPPNSGFGISIVVGTPFNDYSMIFFNSTHDLIANDTFYPASWSGLLLYNGGPFFDSDYGLVSSGGGNNTIWGNHFAGNGTTGLTEAESNDLVYNNRFTDYYTAETISYDLYTADGETYGYLYGLSPDYDRWNVSRQPSTVVHFAPGFPLVPLTGSIVGTDYQGGNSWWNYGVVFPPNDGPSSPYGELPYRDGYQIIDGGDYVPLTRTTLYASPVLLPDGLPPGVAIPAEITWQNGTLLDVWTLGDATRTVYLPNGTYIVGLTLPAGWVSSAAGETLIVNGSGPSIDVPVQPAPGFGEITFSETGIPAGGGDIWAVNITELPGSPGYRLEGSGEDPSSPTLLTFSVPFGRYPVTIFESNACGYLAHHARRNVDVGATATVVPVVFHLVSSGTGCPRLVVHEVGLPHGKAWSVDLAGVWFITRRGATFRHQVPPGRYYVGFFGPPGYEPVVSGEVTEFEVGVTHIKVVFVFVG